MTARGQARDRREVRQGRERHRGHPGPDRAAHAPDQPPDRAPARAQARPPLAPRPADARRPPPPLPQLPPEEGPRGVPLADPRARSAPVAPMAVIVAAGQPAPDFSLRDLRGRAVHARRPRGPDHGPGLLPVRVLAGLHGPAERLQRAAGRLRERGRDALRRLLRRDAGRRRRSRSSSASTIEQLSDFEPKGATCRAFGVLHPGGFPQRALVHDRPRRARALELPGGVAGRSARREPDLRRARGLSELGSAPLPPVGPGDHVRGPSGAPLVIVYGDYECPFCAALEVRLRELSCEVCFRHFPVRVEPPARATPRRCAAEAAGAQGAFWPMHDALFADQGASRTRTCGRAPRRSGSTSSASTPIGARTPSRRASAHFRGGVRAGVVTTPTLFVGGRIYPGRSLLE